MPHDRDKLLNIMKNLESDYRQGKISAEKYGYFRSKYEDKLNSIDAEAATKKIRSMQGKASVGNKRKTYKKKGNRPTNNKRKEEQDLVQKYIINPKKGDNDYNKKKQSMDSGTFTLILVLVLVIGFTVGVAYGVFNFDFDNVSDTATVAIVEDTAFPEIKEVITKNVTDTKEDTNTSNDEIEEYTETEEETTTVTETETNTNQQDRDNSNQGRSDSQDNTQRQSQKPAETGDDEV